jgi:GTP-binding protein
MKALFETIIEYVPAPGFSLDAPFPDAGQHDRVERLHRTHRLRQGSERRDSTRERRFVRTSTQWTNKDRSQGAFEVTGAEETKAADLGHPRLDRVEVEEAFAGDINWISGPKDISIGDTFAAADQETVLAPLDIEEPTVVDVFLVNTGPFAGQRGRRYAPAESRRVWNAKRRPMSRSASRISGA